MFPFFSFKSSLFHLSSPLIDVFLDFLEKESHRSGIMERYKRFQPENPIDVERVVLQVIKDLKDHFPEAMRKEGESEIRDMLPAYSSSTHERMRNIIGFLVNFLFDQEDREIYFIEYSSDLVNLPSLNDGEIYVAMANHTSNLDNLILACLLDYFGLGLGHFVAGSNLMFLPKVEQLLKQVNVIKVERSVKKRKTGRLYPTLLKQACQRLAQDGGNFILYPEATLREGARTRDGNLRNPGRLKILEGFVASGKDVVVIPFGLSYSRVPEYYELLHRNGKFAFMKHRRRKEPLCGKANLSILARWRRFLTSYQDIYGRAYASIGSPVYVKEYLSQAASVPEAAALVAEEAMRRIAKVKKIVPSAVAAKALASGTNSSHQVSDNMLREIDRIIQYHQSVFQAVPNFSSEFSDGVKTVLDAGLAELELTGIIERKSTSGERFLVRDPAALEYYGNMCDHQLYESGKTLPSLAGAATGSS